MTYLFFLIFAFWCVKGLDLVLGMARMPFLARTAPGSGPLPRVSILFSARDEAPRVGDAVRTLLAQEYPDFEVLAVDDRSTDRTAEILGAVRDPRFRLLSVRELPAGWLGKTHALDLASREATGEWLLFTDADVQMAPQTLRLAVSACRDGTEHLTLFPELISKHLIESAFTNYFALWLNLRFRPWDSHRSRSRAFAGIGAFNLVRRRAYDAAGGHRALALEVADDMMLGKRTKAAGARLKVMHGRGLVRVRWVEGFRGVMAALHKNAYRGLHYDWRLLAAATAALPLADIAPFIVALCASGAARAWALGSAFAIGAVYAGTRRYADRALGSYLLHPVTAALFLVVLWRSAASVWCEGGIRWRGTFYPVESLQREPL